MRYSGFFLHTLREAPAEAEVISHKLMIRAGLIKKLAAGIYTYLPLGLRSIRKFEAIVRQEMNQAGAQELLMPAIQPAELWNETERWQVYGKELLRMKDRHERDFCFGPTHEEVITDLCRRDVRSYRDLPLNLYQIQTKFRDEIRPRFGLMRGREFIMKDAYSFDEDPQKAQKSYWKMYETYKRIFERCGLNFVVVEALTGNIGGSLSHEFQVLAPSGEDVIAAASEGDYAANIDKAEIGDVSFEKPKNFSAKEIESITKIETPGKRTVEEVSQFCKKTPADLLKTLIYWTPSGFIAACIRGDHEGNEFKIKNLAKVDDLRLASEEETREVTGAPVGFAGPIGLKIPVFLDQTVNPFRTYLTGANEKDLHFQGVLPGRDFKAEKIGDLRMALEGDPAPGSKGRLRLSRGIEVGQVFYLGSKYSKALKAVYLNRDGKETLIEMGCYGIGIGRTIAAAIEQNHDDKGIIFPMPLAPFQVCLINLGVKNPEVKEVCERIYEDLGEAGIEVLYDDRDERAGVKFYDAELIGIPLQLVLGKKSIQENVIEVKERHSGKMEKIALDQILAHLKKRISQELN